MKARATYRVLPLPLVEKEAKKILSAKQLKEGIRLTKKLKNYPQAKGMKIERCGDGIELKIESAETPSINKQGWLRAIFWVWEVKKTIFIVDLFWKKTNQISKADIHRANHRIRGLKEALLSGNEPWESKR
jgi:phage-related protein